MHITSAFHIFAPITFSTNWVEQILGMVIKPIQSDFGTDLRWMWVTRYGEALESVLPVTTTDDAIERTIPDSFVLDGMTRRIIFRTGCDETTLTTMRERLIELCASNGLHLRITPWDIVSDLGSDRFAHPDSDDIARAHRAELVALFVDATVKLMLDSMVEENGQWRLETWQHRENHSGSFFDSMHHMFCNLTDFTLMVQMQMSKMQGSEDDVLLVRTPYMPGFAPINLKKITDKFSWWRLKS